MWGEMIPKVIHYCWISGDPFPEKIQKCVNSWHQVLPDYEFVLWDAERIAGIGSRYVNEAVTSKQFAFAADFIRFYALYTYGGIYLDSDVEVLKPFDDLLGLRYFIGKENSWNVWEPAIIGAEAGIPWMKRMLRWWRMGKKSFTDMWGKPQMQVLPWVCKRQLADFGIKDCYSIDEWTWSDQYICRFPADWFSPKSWETLEIAVSDKTYSIHHFAATWKSSDLLKLRLTPMKQCLKMIRGFFSHLKFYVLKKNNK